MLREHSRSGGRLPACYGDSSFSDPGGHMLQDCLGTPEQFLKEQQVS